MGFSRPVSPKRLRLEVPTCDHARARGSRGDQARREEGTARRGGGRGALSRTRLARDRARRQLVGCHRLRRESRNRRARAGSRGCSGERRHARSLARAALRGAPERSDPLHRVARRPLGRALRDQGARLALGGSPDRHNEERALARQECSRALPRDGDVPDCALPRGALPGAPRRARTREVLAVQAGP